MSHSEDVEFARMVRLVGPEAPASTCFFTKISLRHDWLP
jgi:hypothetical protein